MRVFRSTCYKEQLSVAAFMVPENVLVLTIRIGMRIFLCLNKLEKSFVFLLQALLHFE